MCIDGIDLTTPRNVLFSAFYCRSFAYHTVKNRMPALYQKFADDLAKANDEIGQKFGKEGQQDLNFVINELRKLKNEIETNQPLRKLTSQAPDIEFYNNYVAEASAKHGSTFRSTLFLLAEDYSYRRVQEAFELTNTLQHYDLFFKEKQESYFKALPAVTTLAQHLIEVLNKSDKPSEEEFVNFLKLNLWGNKGDLTLSAPGGAIDKQHENHFNVETLEANLLCDHSREVWCAVSDKNKKSYIVDFVFDNSGYELFTDLCMADYLISTQLACKIRFYVKTIPWFLSDVMTHDFHWLIEQMICSTDKSLNSLGCKWQHFIDCKVFEVIEHDFWTLPCDFTYMTKYDVCLYRMLSEANLVIIKGDMNYRKLFGDVNWNPTTPVDVALQNFHPTNLCVLRTLKCELICGLDQKAAEKIETFTDNKWMLTGEFGVIQFSNKVVPA